MIVPGGIANGSPRNWSNTKIIVTSRRCPQQLSANKSDRPCEVLHTQVVFSATTTGAGLPHRVSSKELLLPALRSASAEQVINSVMTKLQLRAKGIVLMHDFQHATAEAIPELLKQLKENGYKVVQGVLMVKSNESISVEKMAMFLCPR
jgi:hypothetical protein